jgi:hypothetical protein
MASQEAKLQIFTKRRVLVYEKDINGFDPSEFNTRWWDGTNTKNNRRAEPGIYLYLITKDGEAICEGTVVLVR